MARRPNTMIRNLLIGSLIILAAMHPTTVGRLANIAVSLILAIVQGAANAAADQPGPALLAGVILYAAHAIRTHRPHTTHARH